MKRPASLTPMMEHWWQIKAKYQRLFPGSVVAYRMGDFYEYFYEDAEVVAKAAGITLTSRGKPPNSYALAGVPHHAAKNHFKKLLARNLTVVVVEQLEDPKKATGPIVRRGVVGVLSPGTVTDDEMLDARKNNFICAVNRLASRKQDRLGAAFVDLSCGEFWTWEGSGGEAAIRELLALFAKYEPVECLLPPALHADEEFKDALRSSADLDLAFKRVEEASFDPALAREELLERYGVSSLSSFELEGKAAATSAAGALVKFLAEVQANPLVSADPLAHLRPPRRVRSGGAMVFDVVSQRGLEVLHNFRDNTSRGTLLETFDEAVTPMGGRLLRKWLVEPLVDVEALRRRLRVVRAFHGDFIAREDFRDALRSVGDLERLISAVNQAQRCNARHLVNLARSLDALPRVASLLERVGTAAGEPYLLERADALPDFAGMVAEVRSTLVPDPPATVTEGGLIARGRDRRVDELRDALENGKNWILEFERRERRKVPKAKRGGLKVGYNNVLGYYVQVTKKTLEAWDPPPEYEQRATLVNAVRFKTAELAEIERKVNSAEEDLKLLEYELFSRLRSEVAGRTADVQQAADVLAELDVLVTFAEVAAKRDYVEPEVDDGYGIEIEAGRHPVVEAADPANPFVPNDAKLDEDHHVLLITGPNMSGKSTYLRQVALIVLLAQVGSFVPARRAKVGVVDRIFTRIGASDDLASRRSTFMVEMTETAVLLNNATPRSLVVIDELGRGTSTTDGLSIARAVLEHLHDAGVKTLFSTHFHVLTEVGLPRLANFHLAIDESGGRLNFVRKLVPGGTSKSYGVHVAALAGIPPAVVERAAQLVQEAERSSEAARTTDVAKVEGGRSQKRAPAATGPKSRGRSAYGRVLGELLRVDVNNVTPVEALEAICRWQEAIRNARAGKPGGRARDGSANDASPLGKYLAKDG
ncbi:MAG: DNA mismatch repair protein MutS [Promethearchaeota archaeon]